jgi:cbb3-type cytochrome oxidase cytochrome c subunit
MHVIFGISSLVLLLTTIWMLADDHMREWKSYQRNFHRIQSGLTELRVDSAQTLAYNRELSELEDAYTATLRHVPDKAAVDEFRDVVLEHDPDADWSSIEQQYEQLSAAGDDAKAGLRASLVNSLEGFIKNGKVQQSLASRRIKFARAELSVVLSNLDIARHADKPQSEIDSIQASIDKLNDEIDNRLLPESEAADAYVSNLDQALAKIRAPEIEAQAAKDQFQRDLNQRVTAMDEQRISFRESLLELPIIDAFGGPLKPKQIWLPELTINNNFRDVARFDRCVSCHLGMTVTAPGSATEPGMPLEETLSIALPTPEDEPRLSEEQLESIPRSQHANLQLIEAFGLSISAGIVQPNDVVLGAVYDGTPAARAGLQIGDVIAQIDGVTILDRAMAVSYLLERPSWGTPLSISVRRGVPHPYSSHPRLDLFLGSTSPHPVEEMGCTICHEGQGSATAFKWASHTPNSIKQRDRWSSEYGWFYNHFWEHPMSPQRFVESGCLKCHHEVTELEPSQRYPEAPAPTLVKGRDLFVEYGCYGCHEVNGFASLDQRLGPDVRAEPNYVPAALQLLNDEKLAPELRQLAHQVVASPTDDSVRKELSDLLQKSADGKPTKEILSLADILGADDPTPGTYRKVGPSLRYLASKVDFQWLYSWIEQPSNFRPTTRMPQFFGLHEHLKLGAQSTHDKAAEGDHHESDADHSAHDEAAAAEDAVDAHLRQTLGLEEVEIFATASYLLEISQDFSYADRPSDVTVEPSTERGKDQFLKRGCLACHEHDAFPDAKQTQGPDLSRMGDKLTTPAGKQWLYSWLKDPNNYHARTKMPNLFLTPQETTLDGQTELTDPAADITTWLLTSSQEWKPSPAPEAESLNEDLDHLMEMYLEKSFGKTQAARVLKDGISEDRKASIQGDERLLLGPINTDKKLRYIARKTINKYGCSGCHDIPGFEDAKPIGTALGDWGKKESSKLAFELITEFLAAKHGQHGGHGLDLDKLPDDDGFFIKAILEHRREGFIWQKLQNPRSYDYKKTENKGYNERLRMPKFPLSDDDIEAIMTFVLGLVAEPPAAQYVYTPDVQQRAIVQGRDVLNKYNCGGCHELNPGAWEIQYDPDDFEDVFGSPVTSYEWDFLNPHFSPRQLAASAETDGRGLGHATMFGKPKTDGEDKPILAEDDDGNPLFVFSLNQNLLINGDPWLRGVKDLLVPENRITNRREPEGGHLARFLYPIVLADEQKTNPGVEIESAWGWVPPPLLGEGTKVQPDWLHSFLLSPYPIRPAVVLRMPRFNMSSEEASRLVDYFAAADGAEFPYEFDDRTKVEHLSQAEAQHPDRLKDAFRIVINQDYCVKCHLIGDFRPAGSPQALAPQLDQVHSRLRPDFLRGWLAKPKVFLPYTGMPENFKNAAAESLYPGTREEQLDAVVDLLLNYDQFMKEQTSIKSQVKTAPPPEEAPPADDAGEE